MLPKTSVTNLTNATKLISASFFSLTHIVRNKSKIKIAGTSHINMSLVSITSHPILND